MNPSGYGLDHLWQAIIDAPPTAIAILDAVSVVHTRPIGASYDRRRAAQDGWAIEDGFHQVNRYEVRGLVMARPLGYANRHGIVMAHQATAAASSHSGSIRTAVPPPTPLEAGDVGQAVAELRAAPIDLLLNEDWLEREFLLRLGLNDEMLEEFPAALYPWCGRGVKSWQYPRQFSRYLRFLADKQIQSYVEIGSRHGGTFIITAEYLDRFAGLHHAPGSCPK